MQTRRQFLATTTAAAAATAAGAATFVPFSARAGGHSGDVFAADGGQITVHPIAHASFVMETPSGTIYVDPVGDPSSYDGLPEPDMVLITHQHGDHFDADTLAALMPDGTPMITNPAVYDMLPAAMQGTAGKLANGESGAFGTISIEAIPAYNLTEERLKYHPKGRDNGYVLTIDGLRVYIGGDTEDIPEMRALKNIGLAFVPMNLPYTMGIEAAASAVAEFKPAFVYPYHYKGSDIDAFTAAVQAATEAVEVKRAAWYA